MSPVIFETHDVSRHFAAEAAARFHADHASPNLIGTEPTETPAAAEKPFTPQSSRDFDILLHSVQYYLETGEIHGRTIADAIDLARGVDRIRYPEGELKISPQDRERLVELLLPRWGGPRRAANVIDDDLVPDAQGYGTPEESMSSDPHDEFRQGIISRPSARLNLLAAGQSLAPSPATPSVRGEMAATSLDLSKTLDTRHPIDPTDALKIQGVLAATHTDLEGLAVQGLAASTRVNAGFGDLVGRAVDALVAGTNRTMEALAAGALQRVFESQTTVERGAVTDARGCVIAPATREHSHFRENENFPSRTSLQAGGGTVRVTGAPVSLHSGFKAAAAALADERGRVDPDVRVSARAGENYSEASGYGDSVVAAAGGASVQIGAPSATITLGPTTISRG